MALHSTSLGGSLTSIPVASIGSVNNHMLSGGLVEVAGPGGAVYAAGGGALGPVTTTGLTALRGPRGEVFLVESGSSANAPVWQHALDGSGGEMNLQGSAAGAGAGSSSGDCGNVGGSGNGPVWQQQNEQISLAIPTAVNGPVLHYQEPGSVRNVWNLLNCTASSQNLLSDLFVF